MIGLYLRNLGYFHPLRNGKFTTQHLLLALEAHKKPPPQQCAEVVYLGAHQNGTPYFT